MPKCENMFESCVNFIGRGVVFMFLMGLISCQQNEDKNTGSIYVNFFKKQGTLKDSGIRVENKYIILSEDSIGSNLLKQIDKIVVKDSIIYVADTYMKNLFLYDINGNFISSVGEKGEGPDGNLSLSDFCVDDKGYIYWYDGLKNRVQIYDEKLSLVNHHKLSFKAECLQWEDGAFLFSLAPYNEDPSTKGKCIAYTDSLFVLQNTLFDYGKNIDLNVEFYSPFVTVSDGVSYNRVVNNNVFVLKKGLVNKSLYFDFGLLNVEEEYLSDLNGMFEKGVEYCYIASTPLFYEDMILGCLNKNGELYTFVFDVREGKSYIGRLMEYDSCWMNIPLSLSDCGEIISFVNQEIYPNYNDDEILSDEMKHTLGEGGFLVCFSRLDK